MKNSLLFLYLFLIKVNQIIKAQQYVAGTSIITWQTATTGSAIVILSGTPATIAAGAIRCVNIETQTDNKNNSANQISFYI